jgi:hypothetical protein
MKGLAIKSVINEQATHAILGDGTRIELVSDGRCYFNSGGSASAKKAPKKRTAKAAPKKAAKKQAPVKRQRVAGRTAAPKKAATKSGSSKATEKKFKTLVDKYKKASKFKSFNSNTHNYDTGLARHFFKQINGMISRNPALRSALPKSRGGGL